jgi:acyl-[acyl-carrier-protein]-phospholipid O-acyltransferase/long-chain-fatty-acid--[acyl-carrier-protein] ligase
MPSAVALAVLAAVVGYLVVARFVPAVLKPLFWVIAHATYRFHVYHRDRVPATGPALIVCNHVTYLDWLLVWAASPRPVTFVIWSGFGKHPVLRVGLSYARHRLIEIDSTRRRPKELLAALASVSAALDDGRVVLVFPEQTLSRNGQMLPFNRGIERILKGTTRPVPVVPAYLDGLWGGLFSWERGRILWKWPRGPFRRPVGLYFGEPLPATSTAAEVRLAVQECNARCGVALSDYLHPAPQAFVRRAARFGSLFKTAFVDVATGTERKLTFGRALVAVWSLADWLRPRVGDQRTVGVWLPTGLGATLVNLAVGFLGRTVVNLNYTAGLDPVRSAVGQAGLATVVTSKRFLDRIPLQVPAGVTVVHLEDALADIARQRVGKVVKFLAVVLLPGWVLDRLVLRLRAKLDDPITILFSSGSTGEPKGVMLSHRNVVTNADGIIRAINLQREDRMLSTLPVFHSFGYTVCMWAPALVGMESVYFPDPRQGKEVGELCRKYKSTILLGTATFARFYLRRAQPGDFDSLRYFVCGAEKLPVKLAEEFRDKFGLLPLEGYGCTELSPVVSVNLPDVEVGGVRQVANTMGTVGQPIPGVCARAFDPDTYQPLPPGVEGMIGVTGPNVMLGYLHQPAKTAEVVRDGWYMTGDIGLIEDAGFIRITGRVSRFAKIAGEMVPLERLDEEMHDILGLSGERVLAVAAVPDDRRGERVVVLHLAAVADRLTQALDGLRARGLPNLWVPDVRDCHPVEAFPVLGSGKLDLRGLAALAKTVAGRNLSV